jgi:hypothetical protein
MQLPRRACALTALALIAPMGLAACGSDDTTARASGTPSTTTTSAPLGPPVIAVTGVNYAYQGLPKTAAAGTDLRFTNGSKDEPHELVLFKLPAGESRSLQELLALPEDEVGKVTGPPVGVAVAATPGKAGIVVEGKLELTEPGRYVALCGLPVGADPKVYEEAAKDAGPPPEDPNAGPPHFTRGMIQEITVQ